MSATIPSPVKKLTDKIALAQLAQRGGVTTTFMRKLVRETIAIIEAGLLRDGIVKIHHFGTFRLETAKSAVPQVVFQPAKNIRESVLRAFGPTVHTGSRVSLPALLEKHLAWLTPSGTIENVESPAFEKSTAAEPAHEKFDINEVFPNLPDELPPRLTFAETAAAENELAPTPAEVKISAAPPVHTPPANGKPLNGQASKFTFAAPPENAAPVFPPAFFEPNRLPPKPVAPIRQRPFAWYAGAVAALMLLLLFLLPGRLGEKSKPASGSVSPETTRVVVLSNETTKLKNGASQLTPTTKTSAKPPPFFAGGTHRVIPEENLWKISGRYYRNPYLWPNIYRVNTGAIPNPDRLERDQQLALPILYGPPEQLTLEDRHHLAEGYFLLYRYYRTHEPALAPFALWAAVRYDARIRSEYAAELSADDWAFLQAHDVSRQVAER